MTPRRFARLCAIADRRQPDLTVLMDGVHNPHNVSAVIRTCDAVAISELHVISPDETFSTHAASAQGAEHYVETVSHPQRALGFAALRSQGLTILAAHPSPTASDFREVDYTRPTAVVLGAERNGVHPEALRQADGAIVIPMLGAVSSLNVSVAAAVILFEAQRQRFAAGMYDTPRLAPSRRRRQLFEWAHPRVAAACRRRGLPYPELDDHGQMIGPLPGR